MPILGVCLGHQAIGEAYGGLVVRAPEPMHGKVSRIHHTGKSVFRGLNGDFLATRYHSLTIAPESLPAALEVTATSDDGVIQGVMHKTHPVHGVQFHPKASRRRTATRCSRTSSNWRAQSSRHEWVAATCRRRCRAGCGRNPRVPSTPS